MPHPKPDEGRFGESGKRTLLQVSDDGMAGHVEMFGPRQKSNDWTKILGPRHGFYDLPHSLPATDHPRLHRDAKGKYTFVSHPYHIFSYQAEEMIAVAKKYGLKFTIDGRGGYYPGHAVCIVWRKDTNEEDD